ncbi:MAG: phosphoserine phosphatase SerB [Oligoflexus sp.]
MAWFKLVAHEQNIPEFLPFCGKPKPIPNQNPAMVAFEWEALTIHPEVLSLIRQQNQAGKTCLHWEVKPYRAIFFDMDSTVIAQESIVELARFAGTAEDVHRITELAMEGKLDFNEALAQRVATLKGQPVSILQEVSQRLTLHPGIIELCQAAKSHNVELYLISGGFHELAAHIAGQLSFNGYRANFLERRDGVLTGKVVGAIVNAQEKYQYLVQTCREKSFHAQDIIAIGDGANDLPMLNYAGLSIGYRPKEILLPHLHGAVYDSFAVLQHLFR